MICCCPGKGLINLLSQVFYALVHTLHHSKKARTSTVKSSNLGFQYDTFVGTALTDRMPRSILRLRGLHAMIQGLAENGFAKESVLLFEEMERASSSIKANELILLAVLFACSHCGRIDKGLQYFNSMEKVYGVKPSERHYTCMVDMYVRCLHQDGLKT